jgi:hypothetical protein
MNVFEVPVGDPQEQPDECENAARWSDLPHEGVKTRKFPTGWNGFEYAYEDYVVMCEECWKAAQEVRWLS